MDVELVTTATKQAAKKRIGNAGMAVSYESGDFQATQVYENNLDMDLAYDASAKDVGKTFFTTWEISPIA